MSAFRVLLIVMFALGCCFCRKPEAADVGRQQDLKILQMTDDFGSVEAIHNPGGMFFADGFLYISDHDHHRVVKLDQNMKGVLQYGQTGEGPGEFQSPGAVTVAQGRVFVMNGMRQTVEAFDVEGNYLHTTPVPGVGGMQFAVLDDQIFSSTPSEPHPISVFNVDGTVVNGFGEVLFPDSPRPSTRNHSYVLITELNNRPIVVAVSLSEPLIFVYTLEGVLMYKKDVSTNPHLADKLRITEAFYADPANIKNTMHLFAHAAVYGKTLKVLLNNKEKPQKILEFELGEAELKFVGFKQINLDAFHTNISALDEKRWFVFDAVSDQFILFE